MSDRNESIPRLEKAFSILKDDFRIFDIDDTYATVISNGHKYRVNHVTNECDCWDCVSRHLLCKHLYAVLIKVGKMKVDKIGVY